MSGINEVAALPHRFNELQEASRVLMVLSPTCPECVQGAGVVASAGATGVLVTWTDMRPGDSVASATQVAAELPTHFVHFWEGEPWPVSTALRPLLGLGSYDATQSAWDVYLFYAAGVAWTGPIETPPPPTEWAHNLVDDPGVGARLDANAVRRWFS